MTGQTVSSESRAAVYARANGRCERCRKSVDYDSQSWHWHHCIALSEYIRADRHEAWNGACLCVKCHEAVHASKRLYLQYKIKAMDRAPKTKAPKDPELASDAGERTNIYIDKKRKVAIAKGQICPVCNKAFRAKDKQINGRHKTCFWKGVNG